MTKVELPIYDNKCARSDPRHPFYDRHDRPFDRAHFEHPTLPVHVGPFDLDVPKVNMQRVHVKLPGSRTLDVPESLESAIPFIRYCCDYEESFTDLTPAAIHITTHTRFVDKGETQRSPGWHTDGYQGPEIRARNVRPEHSYVWASREPTEFCVQPFFLRNVNDAVYNVFAKMEREVNECNVYRGQPKNVYLIDPYMVHRSPPMKERCTRSFVRVVFEYEVLRDPRNSKGALVDDKAMQKFDMFARLDHGEPVDPFVKEPAQD